MTAFVWRLVSTFDGVAGIFFFWPMALVVVFFCDYILVDQSLPETALSPCYGHSLVSFVSRFLRRLRLLMCMRTVD